MNNNLNKCSRDEIREKVAKLKIMKTNELRKLKKRELIDVLNNNFLFKTEFSYDDSLFCKWQKFKKRIYFIIVNTQKEKILKNMDVFFDEMIKKYGDQILSDNTKVIVV